MILNISALVLAAATVVSLSATSERASVAEPLEPIVEVWDGTDTQLITVEDYVTSCVMHEMPYTFHEEALKAQAVAARTYFYYCEGNGSFNHEKGDVCTYPNHCMGFITYEGYAERYGSDAASKALSAAVQATEATRGKVMTYDGEIILSVWHSSSHSYTEDSGEVWLTSLPYLSPVPTYEDTEVSEITFTLSHAKQILASAGYKVTDFVGMRKEETPSGRCSALVFNNERIDGGEIRRLFSLKSTDFDVVTHNGELRFTVRGYGHGVGMSQYGANELAKRGFDFSRILMHYYSGAEISNINVGTVAP